MKNICLILSIIVLIAGAPALGQTETEKEQPKVAQRELLFINPALEQ